MITSKTWAGERYAVLGLARSGRATVEALIASGAQVVAWDESEAGRDAFLRHAGGGAASEDLSRDSAPWTLKQVQGDGAFVRGDGSLSLLDPLTLDLTGFAGVVVSPGVPLNRHPIAAHAAKYGVPVIGDIELFAQARAELPPHKVVGITGTNGKSTTTALVHHILKTAGVPTTMGGNIGLPILGQEPLPDGGVYVLELSSFQIDLTFTLDCDVAVLLNITPDHLDRYDGFEAYAASKARLFAMQSVENAVVVAGDDNETRKVAASEWLRRPQNAGWHLVHGGVSVAQTDWPALQGPHNSQNAAAAKAACNVFGLSEGAIQRALRTYPGLPHRMERVRECDGVLFVNDSKATNPTSTAPALAAYPVIHWILGGQAKTNELDACAPHFGHVRAAYTIGDAAGMFADLLRPHMAVRESGTLENAVLQAAAAAKAGETVLLSPACASFDQFRDYEERGDSFRRLVEAL